VGRAAGFAMLAAPFLLVPLYAYLMFLAPRDVMLLAVRVTVFLGVALLSIFLGVLGYAVVRTGRRKSIEEIRREVEEEIRKFVEKRG